MARKEGISTRVEDGVWQERKGLALADKRLYGMKYRTKYYQFTCDTNMIAGQAKQGAHCSYLLFE